MSKQPPHKVELVVGGEVFGGWKSGEVTQGLDQLASTFALEYVDHWAGRSEPWPIEEGMACEVRIDGEVLVKGYVDDSDSEYGPDDWSLSISGRSKLGDLVDCSAVKDGHQWLNASLVTIVGDLLAPFGLQSIVLNPGRPFRRFKFEPGEPSAEVLSRVARMRGYIPVDSGGDLSLVRAGSGGIVETLRRGENIIRGRRMGSWRERFSEYRFKGQTQASDELNGKSASQLEGVVEDPHIDRMRPFVVVAGGQDGENDLGKRAILERNRRAGRSERLAYKVPGFRRRDGELWRPNVLVKVEDSKLRVDATLLVVAVRMPFGPDTEMVTHLELTRPEAYDLADYPARGRGAAWQ